MKIFDCIKQEEIDCEIVECDINIENYSGNLCWTLSKTKEDFHIKKQGCNKINEDKFKTIYKYGNTKNHL